MKDIISDIKYNRLTPIDRKLIEVYGDLEINQVGDIVYYSKYNKTYLEYKINNDYIYIYRDTFTDLYRMCNILTNDLIPLLEDFIKKYYKPKMDYFSVIFKT